MSDENEAFFERYKHLEDRVGMVSLGGLNIRAAQRAVRRSVPTMDHAARVFDAVATSLGAGAWIDPEGGEHRRRLYRHDPALPGWLVAQWAVEHAWQSGDGSVVIGPTFVNANAPIPADAPPGWKHGDPWFAPGDPPPEVYPRGPTMRAGALKVRCGAAHFDCVYNARGLYHESMATAGDSYTVGRYDGVRAFAVDPRARPPQLPPLALLCRDDLDEGGVSVATFARMITELDPCPVPARVLLPVPLPGGAEGAWHRARKGLRDALWNETIAPAARWAIADGFEGSAVAHGDTVDEAWERWQHALFRAKPKPPSPTTVEAAAKPPPEPPRTITSDDGKAVGYSTGTITLRGPAGADIPWPAAVPSRTPAALVPLPPMPAIPEVFAAAGFTRRVRLLGAYGAVSHALVREEPDGLTLIGEGVIDLVDPATLGDTLASAMAKYRESFASLPESFRSWQSAAWTVTSFSCWNNGHQRAMAPAVTAMSAGGAFNPASLDGDGARWCVTRVRRER